MRRLTLRGCVDLCKILRVVPGLRVLHLQGCNFMPYTPQPSFHINLDKLITDADIPIRCRVELHFNKMGALAVLEGMDPTVLRLSTLGYGMLPSDGQVARCLPSLRYLDLHVLSRPSCLHTPPKGWIVGPTASGSRCVSLFMPIPCADRLHRSVPPAQARRSVPAHQQGNVGSKGTGARARHCWCMQFLAQVPRFIHWIQ